MLSEFDRHPRRRPKTSGLELFARATWHRGLLESRPVSSRPVSPEVIERETDAHKAAVQAFQALLRCDIDPDELVETDEAQHKIGLIAMSHMLADAWRVVCSLPRLQAAQIEALAKMLAGSGAL